MYHGEYTSTPSPYMGGLYGSYGLNIPLPLDHNLFSNTQLPFFAMHGLLDLL